MDNPRPKKVAEVDEVRRHLQNSSAAILTEYRGMRVKHLQQLRRALAPTGAQYKIYKNTLVKIAADSVGLADLEPLLHGPTAIAFVTGDAVEAAKALREFAKGNQNLVVKGGVLGTKVFDAAQATALADMPPKKQVLAEIAGLLEAPLANIASLLEAPVRDIAYAIAALEDKYGGAAA